jgi:hypothetical protein
LTIKSGIALTIVLLSIVTLMTISTSSNVSSAATCSNPNGNIIITTISQIRSGTFCSAKLEKGSKDIFGNTIQTKTLGLDGVMVEVEGVTVKAVSGPNHDCDFDIIITSSGSRLKTQNPIFPQSSTCPKSPTSPPYIVPLPSVGQHINIVGTPFFDLNHWEIHPIFAWDSVSKGVITSVCAPKGTVSNTARVCFSGTTTA